MAAIKENESWKRPQERDLTTHRGRENIDREIHERNKGVVQGQKDVVLTHPNKEGIARGTRLSARRDGDGAGLPSVKRGRFQT